MSYQNKNKNKMEITTNNIVQLIEDYTNTEQVEICQVTKKNNDDYQVWDRSNPNTKVCDLKLLPGLSFDDVKWIMFYYTSKDNGEVVGLNTIELNEIIAYHKDRKNFIKKIKLPQLERQLEKHVEKEEYDYAVRNRDFINHLKNQLK